MDLPDEATELGKELADIKGKSRFNINQLLSLFP
jgi:hypothetical protein